MQNSKTTKPALLVSVQICQWVGRKLDKTATATATNAHGATHGTGNFTKKLLPEATELQRISTLVGQIRDFVNTETLPWMTDGTRILSAVNYLDFVSKFGAKKSEFETAVADFIAVYPQLVANAQSKLGGLYNSADYPDQNRLANAFDCQMILSPLPDVSDFRIELGDAERKAFERHQSEVQAKAMLDCWTRLHEVVKTAAERLADPKANFRDTLVSNIIGVCQLLPRLNYANDPTLETERVKIEQLATSLSPELLRTNATDRQNAADLLRDIESKMASIMGNGGKKS